MYSVDLRAAVLDAGQPAYMIHPGKGYHLFAAFLGHGVVAPDLPELNVRNGADPANIQNLDVQINRARALRDWLSLNSTDRAATEFSTKLEDYQEAEPRRYHDSYIEHMRSILWELPEGSVIFVPNSDLGGKGFFLRVRVAKGAKGPVCRVA